METKLSSAISLVLLLVGVFVWLGSFQPGEPDKHTSIALQWSAMALVLVGSVVWIVLDRHHFRSSGEADPSLTHPPLAFIALALVALLWNGIFLGMPTLLPVALTAVVVALMLILWPYGSTVCKLGQRVVDLDRFVRLHYFGYTSMLILLGGFGSAAVDPSDKALAGWLIGGLLVIAAAFHVYAYVLNDVIDLEVDRTEPKRLLDPLVRGSIHWSTALALALVQIPAAFLVLFTLGAPTAAYLALASGFVLMTAYNLWGKISPFPPLTDLVQALAWGSLVWVGAFVAPAASNLLVWAVFIFGAGFIFLINGVHGGLRDLRNDVSKARRTTAVLLGSYVDPRNGQVVSSGRLAAFAFSVHTAMFALPLVIMLQFPFSLRALGQPNWSGEFGVPVAYVLVGITFLVSNFYLWQLVKPRETDVQRDAWMQRHVFVILLPPILVFVPLLNLTAAMVLLVTFFGPLLAQSNVVEALVSFMHPGRGNRVHEPIEGEPATRVAPPEEAAIAVAVGQQR